MGIRSCIPDNPEVRAIVEEVATSHCVNFHLGKDNRVWFDVDYARIPRTLEGFIGDLAIGGSSMVLEMLVQGYAYHEGLKVVTLNQLDAEALENTALNFPVHSYNQPFPTLFVDLPPSFFQNHEVDCPQGGEIFAGVPTPGRHYPHTVGLRHVKTENIQYLITTVYFTSHQAFTALLDGADGIETLEESIKASFDPARQLKNSKYISPEEDAVTLAALRVALNTVLILDSEGMKTLGPANPKHYHHLQENVRKARKRQDPAEKIIKAEQILRVEPVYYGFDQHVVIYHREDASENHGPFEHTGRSLRPHWRSGYHKMQRFGIGNTQSRRIRIPSVLVNKHRFLGHTRDTAVTYEIRN